MYKYKIPISYTKHTIIFENLVAVYKNVLIDCKRFRVG